MIITKEQQEYWVSNYVKEKHNNDECIGFIDGIQRVMDNINSLQVNSWQDANKSQPALNDENHSENVLAFCNGQLMVMCYCYNPSEDDSERGFFWSNCNGQIDGDAEFDDEYDVTFWQYLPSIVGFVA
jgi:hypothetical protein